MSTTEPTDTEPAEAGEAAPAREEPLPRFETSIVPKATVAGRALIAVIAIMSFLASLTTGAVMLVRAAAADWQSEVSREVTIQVRPNPGRDAETDVAAVAAIARAAQGVADVRPYSKEESTQLLEPWLGKGFALDDLPIPRIVVVRIAPGGAPDFRQMQSLLSAAVPGASLDDHRGFVDRMRAMARAAVFGGVAVLLLVLVATILSVTFATRGAMASNRPVIEVLFFIGAKSSFIAGHFQRRFLMLGLQGGLIGGGAALALFAAAEIANRWFAGTASGDEFAALFGTFSIGIIGYAVVVAQIVLIAMVTALTSRITVNRTFETLH
jgi:cell division transport system permease protein